jgi:hypothetical protein
MSLADTGSTPAPQPALESEPWRHRYSRGLLRLDAVVIALAVSFAHWVSSDGARFSDYTMMSVAVGVVWLAALTVNHARSPRVVGEGVEEYRRLITATVSVLGCAAMASVLLKFGIARDYLMVAVPLGFAGLVGARWLARRAYWSSSDAR